MPCASEKVCLASEGAAASANLDQLHTCLQPDFELPLSQGLMCIICVYDLQHCTQQDSLHMLVRPLWVRHAPAWTLQWAMYTSQGQGRACQNRQKTTYGSMDVLVTSLMSQSGAYRL